MDLTNGGRSDKVFEAVQNQIGVSRSGFDSDRPALYRAVREDMARIYVEKEYFWPKEISISPIPLGKLTKEEREDFFKKAKAEANSIKKGHNRIVEKLKQIRKNFSKAVTAGTRSCSGKFVYEFYDDLVDIWGSSAATEPLGFGVSSLAPPEIEVIENLPELSESPVQDENSSLYNDDEDEEQATPERDSPKASETDADPLKTRKRPASASTVPRLIDNKRKHLEKTLSSAQRDQIFLAESREDKDIRRELANSVRQSSEIFNTALGNVSSSMNQLGNSICKSIEMLAHAMISANMPNQNQPVHQNLFYQNHGATIVQPVPGIYGNNAYSQQANHSFQQQPSAGTADKDFYQM